MLEELPDFETRCLSSLSKVFADAELHDLPVNTGSAMWKEVFSFQVAYSSPQLIKSLKISAESELEPYLAIRAVGLSPSELPVFPNPDEGYIRTAPGLYPDPLYPLADGVHAVPNQWRSVWVTVSLPSMSEFIPAADIGAESVSFPIDLCFEDGKGNHLGAEKFALEIISQELPEQTLLHTEWFHSDCIATQYKVEVFSEAHWKLIESYVHNAVNHGVNMLLTPLFTPPLDTYVGGERPTVQLIDVEITGVNEYRFKFDRLERWVEMCQRLGIQFIEFSHLFTQWGAKYAPKIIAKKDGEEKRIFGWDTEASGESYSLFLDQFLPQLVHFIRNHHLDDKVFFHVSDEPGMKHAESYRQASDILNKHLAGFSILDALSDYDFYEKGLVQIPVPSNDQIEPFIEHGVEPLWTYYCCGQDHHVSNRFFSLSSPRNRVLGAQLYKFGVQGFLHWGFNSGIANIRKRLLIRSR